MNISSNKNSHLDCERCKVVPSVFDNFKVDRQIKCENIDGNSRLDVAKTLTKIRSTEKSLRWNEICELALSFDDVMGGMCCSATKRILKLPNLLKVTNALKYLKEVAWKHWLVWSCGCEVMNFLRVSLEISNARSITYYRLCKRSFKNSRYYLNMSTNFVDSLIEFMSVPNHFNES